MRHLGLGGKDEPGRLFEAAILQLTAKFAIRPFEEGFPDARQVVSLAPADAEGAAHGFPSLVAVDAALLRFPEDSRLGLPGALINAAKLLEKLD